MIDTRINRLSGEFQKNESSEESHELGREWYQNSGGLGEMLPGGEYLDRHPIPKGVGEMGGGKRRNDPREKKGKEDGKKQNLRMLNWIKAGIFHGEYAQIRFRGGKGSTHCFG